MYRHSTKATFIYKCKLNISFYFISLKFAVAKLMNTNEIKANYPIKT